MSGDVDQTLAALGDPSRRAIIGLLSRRPLRPSELAEALDASRPAVSRHLRVLRRAGVITEEILAEDARFRICRLRREPFVELRGWLDEVEAFWQEQLQSFKRHAEHRSRDS